MPYLLDVDCHSEIKNTYTKRNKDVERRARREGPPYGDGNRIVLAFVLTIVSRTQFFLMHRSHCSEHIWPGTPPLHLVIPFSCCT